jgi:aryl-alcohol dehydrogenase-like predicted oxidoreductase
MTRELAAWPPTEGGTQRAADPGTGSTGHLRENLAAEHVALDDEALRELAGVGVWPS